MEATARVTTLQEALLEHPVREGIYEVLAERPGLNKNQIAEELDLYSHQLEFHLQRLEDHDLIVQLPGSKGHEVLLFRTEDRDLWKDESTRVLFGRAPIREVAMYVAETPGATVREIADATDRSPDAVRYHLRTLREHDLATSLRLARRTEYHPSEQLGEWVDGVGENFYRPWLDPV